MNLAFRDIPLDDLFEHRVEGTKENSEFFESFQDYQDLGDVKNKEFNVDSAVAQFMKVRMVDKYFSRDAVLKFEDPISARLAALIYSDAQIDIQEKTDIDLTNIYGFVSIDGLDLESNLTIERLIKSEVEIALNDSFKKNVSLNLINPFDSKVIGVYSSQDAYNEEIYLTEFSFKADTTFITADTTKFRADYTNGFVNLYESVDPEVLDNPYSLAQYNSYLLEVRKERSLKFFDDYDIFKKFYRDQRDERVISEDKVSFNIASFIQSSNPMYDTRRIDKLNIETELANINILDSWKLIGEDS